MSEVDGRVGWESPYTDLPSVLPLLPLFCLCEVFVTEGVLEVLR